MRSGRPILKSNDSRPNQQINVCGCVCGGFPNNAANNVINDNVPPVVNVPQIVNVDADVHGNDAVPQDNDIQDNVALNDGVPDNQNLPLPPAPAEGDIQVLENQNYV